MVFILLVIHVDLVLVAGITVRAHRVANDLGMHTICISVTTQVKAGRGGKDRAIEAAAAVASPFDHLRSAIKLGAWC